MDAALTGQGPEIQSVRRAAAILRALSGTHRLGVVELGQKIGVSRRTVYGILRTLELDGLVERDPHSGKYQLGASVLPMGFRYLEASALRSASLNSAYRLAAQSGESVRVARLHDEQVLIVHQVPEPGDGRHASDIGGLAPAHATALGKAMLMQGEQAAFRLAAGPLRSYTPATVIDSSELGRQLTAARARGWAQEIEELRPGVASIAAPIFAGPYCGFAAIGIEGPTERICLEGAPRRDLIGAVIQAAGVVARELASVPWLR